MILWIILRRRCEPKNKGNDLTRLGQGPANLGVTDSVDDLSISMPGWLVVWTGAFRGGHPAAPARPAGPADPARPRPRTRERIIFAQLPSPTFQSCPAPSAGPAEAAALAPRDDGTGS